MSSLVPAELLILAALVCAMLLGGAIAHSQEPKPCSIWFNGALWDCKATVPLDLTPHFQCTVITNNDPSTATPCGGK